jgi:hypothetical protein
MSNPIPDHVTIAQTDAALEALGITAHDIGLVSLTIEPYAVRVERFVRVEQPDGSTRNVGRSTVIVPIDRAGREPA